MPSQPRPLGRVRRGQLSYPSVHVRIRRARATRPGSAAPPRSPAAPVAPAGCDAPRRHFEVCPAELPTATLWSGRLQPRRRVLAAHLQHWLAAHWAWLRPRWLPLIAAFAGMLAVVGATRYLSEYARGGERRTDVIYLENRLDNRLENRPATELVIGERLAHAPPTTPAAPGNAAGPTRPLHGLSHVAPLVPRSQPATITLDP